jgi:hypothetical protein
MQDTAAKCLSKAPNLSDCEDLSAGLLSLPLRSIPGANDFRLTPNADAPHGGAGATGKYLRLSYFDRESLRRLSSRRFLAQIRYMAPL